MTCDEITFHYMRNFTTDDGAGQDLQFDDSQAEQPFNVFGWIKVNQSSIAPGATVLGDPVISDVTQTRMVFQDYIDVRDYEPEPEPETEDEDDDEDNEGDDDEDDDGEDDDNEGDDDEDEDDDDDDDDSNDDGATSVTTYAAALFATVYALAF